MEEYTLEDQNNDLNIFPEHIYQRYGVLYHGTSAAYSPNIEAEGFAIGHTPLNIERLQELIDFFGDLGSPSDYQLNSEKILFNEAGMIEQYISRLDRPISLTVSQKAAVDYATGPAKGGQINIHIKRAIDKIKELVEEKEKTGDHTFSNRMHQIGDIIDYCEALENADGVIYAILFPKSRWKDIRFDHKVLFADFAISPELIMAKVIVPTAFSPDANLKSEAQREINKILTTRGTLGFEATKMGQEDDEE